MDGQEIRKRRKKMGLTQDALAIELGVSANTVARWERGEQRIPPMLSLALQKIEDKVTDRNSPQ